MLFWISLVWDSRIMSFLPAMTRAGADIRPSSSGRMSGSWTISPRISFLSTAFLSNRAITDTRPYPSRIGI